MTDDPTPLPQPPRRIPGLGAVVAVGLLLLPLAAVAWWLNRPTGTPPPGPALSELDVVCLGRIDGLAPIASLEPSVPGRVVKVVAAAGAHVEPRQELLRLDDEAFQLKVEEARAAVDAAGVEVEAAKLEQKLHPLRRKTLDAAVAAADGRARAAREVLEEKKAARKFGTVTPGEIIAAEAEARQFEQLAEAEKGRRTELDAADPGLKVKAAAAKQRAAGIALKQAEKAVRDCVLLAPAAGTVLRVQATAGEAVAPGTPLPPVVFRPDGPLVVRADLEQEFLGRVKPGMKATVRDESRADSPTWTGKVLSVGQVVARKRSILMEPGELNDVRTVECVVGLDGDTAGLLVGQRMRVRIARE